MVCPLCIASALAANAPAIGVALGLSGAGARMAFVKRAPQAKAPPPPSCGRRASGRPSAAPPPLKPPVVVPLYSSYPQRDGEDFSI